MDDPLLVRRFERLGDLLRDRQRLVDRDRPARDALRQVLALDEFHHEGLRRRRRPPARRSRRCSDDSARRGLPLRAESGPGGRSQLRTTMENLDGDVTLQLRIAGAIHLAHAPGPQGGKDFVRAKACAGGEGQTAGTSIGQGGASTALLLSDAAVSTRWERHCVNRRSMRRRVVPYLLFPRFKPWRRRPVTTGSRIRFSLEPRCASAVCRRASWRR